MDVDFIHRSSCSQLHLYQILVRVRGLKPPASTLAMLRSNLLSYTRKAREGALTPQGIHARP
jgi:hypothetical protein